MEVVKAKPEQSELAMTHEKAHEQQSMSHKSITYAILS